MSYSRIDIELTAALLIGLGIGLKFFFKGFSNHKLKRMIENTPTSKIQSLSMGLVEIFGKAVKTFEMCTPFSNTPCVFFQYLIEKREGSGKRSHWVTVKRYSSPSPFEIDDGTGSILVNPAEAEVDLATMNRYSNDFFNSLPPNALKFMEMNGISHKSFLGYNERLRLTEYYLRPGDQVYVLGTARHAGDSLESTPEYARSLDRKKYMLAETLKNLKGSPLLLKKYDSNKDGKIDSVEWEKAREDVARWVDYKTDDDSLKRMQDIKLEIAKGKNHPFFVCDKDEREICSKMTWKSGGYIFGGALLTIACVTILLVHIFGWR